LAYAINKRRLTMETEVNDRNFDAEVLKSELPVLVDFWAEWCSPCRMIAPVIKEIAKENADKLKVCKLNVDHSGATAGKYQRQGIPTMAVFKGGKLVGKIVGAQPKHMIMSQLTKFM
jgi:thioredoxin 1